MEREAATRQQVSHDYEAHAADEMTEAELAEMNLGTDFFSAEDLAELCGEALAVAPDPVAVRKTKSKAKVRTIRKSALKGSKTRALKAKRAPSARPAGRDRVA